MHYLQIYVIIGKMNDIAKQFFRVPVSVAGWAVKNNRTQMLAVFIDMKRRSTGHLRLSTEEIKGVCDVLNISMQTFYNNRNELIKRNWIGYNKKKKLYHIRSWDFVCKVLSVPSRSNIEAHIDILKTFHEFCFSIDIAHYVKTREKNARSKDSDRNQRAENETSCVEEALSGKEQSQANKLGVELLAERYGVSKSTISNWKIRAKALGFLKYQHNYAPLNVTDQFVGDVKRAYSELAHRIVCFLGFCYLQLTDSFEFEYTFYSVTR